MTPIAIAISDLHLSLLQPACRADKNWLEVQAHYLAQVREAMGQLPLLCAGDIFDRWNPAPELIHFALKHLPDGMLCVPGQHDLPNHRLDQVHRSGYGVLVEAGKIRDITGTQTGNMGGFVVHGFGWGQPLLPPRKIEDPSSLLKVALIHRYCWIKDKCYPGAPQEAHVAAYRKALKGFDVAVFGDNHLSFIDDTGTCNIMNVGGFIRRKSDEISRQPRMGSIFSDGTVKFRKLDTSKDVFHENPTDRPEVPLDLKGFIEGLEGLGEHGLNFREAVENHLRSEDIHPETKEMILQALAIK